MMYSTLMTIRQHISLFDRHARTRFWLNITGNNKIGEISIRGCLAEAGQKKPRHHFKNKVAGDEAIISKPPVICLSGWRFGMKLAEKNSGFNRIRAQEIACFFRRRHIVIHDFRHLSHTDFSASGSRHVIAAPSDRTL